MTSINKDSKIEFSILTAAKQEYSLQKLRTSTCDLSRCTQQQNECHKIGIIGVRKYYPSDRFLFIYVF